MTADPAPATRSKLRRQLFIFYGVTALVMVVISIGAVVASRSVARGAALHDAERATTRLADLVLRPLLEQALIGDAQGFPELDRSVSARIKDGYLAQVTVWDANGTIMYADESDVIGHRFPTPDEVTAAIEKGTVSSDFAAAPEVNRGDFRLTGTNFVEVYVPVARPGQQTLVFEAYYDYARVSEIADSLLWKIIPLVLIPLLVLQFIQLPIAGSLAGRIRRQDKEQSRLLGQMLSVSEKERMRIAGDLHDGPIQDLAGIGYALAAIAPGVAEQDRSLVGKVQEAVQRANDSLRRMMTEVYPPDLHPGQLHATIADLALPLRESGIDVTVTVEQLPDLDGDAVTTFYRVAREALINIVEHSRATAVKIALGVAPKNACRPRSAVLVVEVDGLGVDPGQLDPRADGHLGLLLLRDRVTSLGGTMTFDVVDPTGTALTVSLPTHQVGPTPPGNCIPVARESIVQAAALRGSAGDDVPALDLDGYRRQ